MIRTFVIPFVIVAVFLSVAATLMATAPVLEPSSETAAPMTVRVQSVETQSVELKVHSQGSVVPSTISQLIPEVSGRVVWTSPSLVAGRNPVPPMTTYRLPYITDAMILKSIPNLNEVFLEIF